MILLLLALVLLVLAGRWASSGSQSHVNLDPLVRLEEVSLTGNSLTGNSLTGNSLTGNSLTGNCTLGVGFAAIAIDSNRPGALNIPIERNDGSPANFARKQTVTLLVPAHGLKNRFLKSIFRVEVFRVALVDFSRIDPPVGLNRLAN